MTVPPRYARTPLAVTHTFSPRFPQPFLDHPCAHSLAAHIYPVALREFLGSQRGTEILIFTPQVLNRLLLYAIGQSVAGRTATAAMNQALVTFTLISPQQTAHMPLTRPENFSSSLLTQLPSAQSTHNLQLLPFTSIHQ